MPPFQETGVIVCIRFVELVFPFFNGRHIVEQLAREQSVFGRWDKGLDLCRRAAEKYAEERDVTFAVFVIGAPVCRPAGHGRNISGGGRSSVRGRLQWRCSRCRPRFRHISPTPPESIRFSCMPVPVLSPAMRSHFSWGLFGFGGICLFLPQSVPFGLFHAVGLYFFPVGVQQRVVYGFCQTAYPGQRTFAGSGRRGDEYLQTGILMLSSVHKTYQLLRVLPSTVAAPSSRISRWAEELPQSMILAGRRASGSRGKREVGQGGWSWTRRRTGGRLGP